MTILLAPGQLSNNRKNNLPSTRSEVFTTLHSAYQQYEQSIDSKKEERESPASPHKKSGSQFA